MKSRLILAMGAATALSMVLFFVAGVELPSGPACAAAPTAPRVSFSEDVLPLLKFRCPACHLPGGEGYDKSGFDISSYETVMKGTKFGPMIIEQDQPERVNITNCCLSQRERQLSTDLSDPTGWTIVRIDPMTGELVGNEEETYRQKIREEAKQGLVGVDALYLSVQQAIHQPLIGEQGTVQGDGWFLKRANRTTLRYPSRMPATPRRWKKQR